MGTRRGVFRIFVGQPNGKSRLEDPGEGGSVIQRWIFRKWDENMDWIYLAQDKDMRRTLLNAAMNLQVP
jgi:hypothetical protein